MIKLIDKNTFFCLVETICIVSGLLLYFHPDLLNPLNTKLLEVLKIYELWNLLDLDQPRTPGIKHFNFCYNNGRKVYYFCTFII